MLPRSLMASPLSLLVKMVSSHQHSTNYPFSYSNEHFSLSATYSQSQPCKICSRWENPLMGWISTRYPHDFALSFDTTEAVKDFTEGHGTYSFESHSHNVTTFSKKGFIQHTTSCYVKGRGYHPDRARAKFKKLKKMHRNEAKEAARELRKDNYFLHEVKEKEKHRAEQERHENYGKVRAFLQEQEHAFKPGQLGKNRKRSR